MSNIIKDPISATLTEEHAKLMSELKKAARAQYGENKRISDGNYDESLAVKCVNGTFVGKKVEDIIVYRGIPFVGRQPIGAGKLLRRLFRMIVYTRPTTTGNAALRGR